MADNTINFRKVNKFQQRWDRKTLFSGYNFCVYLKDVESFIEAAERKELMSRRLADDVGQEDEDWFFGRTDKLQDCFYLKNSIFLMLWKMNSPEDFKEWFDNVEQHTDSEQELAWQIEEDERLAIQAAERKQREREERMEQAKQAQANGGIQAFNGSMNIGGVTVQGGPGVGTMTGQAFAQMMGITSGPNVAPNVAPKTYTNLDNPADWEFVWDISSGEHTNNLGVYDCDFYFMNKHNKSVNLDYDLTVKLKERVDHKRAQPGISSKEARDWLTSLGFTENPKLLLKIYGYDSFTPEQIAEYYNFVDGKISYNEICGKGWTAEYCNTNDYPGETPYEEGMSFFVQPKNGDNDQHYPWRPDGWGEEMECVIAPNDEYKTKEEAVTELLKMGFEYLGPEQKGFEHDPIDIQALKIKLGIK